ncbi:IS66-like element accessory protein TnpA [Microvirga arabica]|uniref:Transposase n=1 Tax=Microvirga arabica TaxID=1128671 RepID=A0ABV6Y3X9_9HYPH|nr:transposase [Microvirga arabica]MBM1175592.1 transposase [Microvirga arabica]
MEIITGRERRRQWSTEEKLRILEEASAPGASAAEVARRHDLLPQQIYTWRRQLRAAHPVSHQTVSFLPVDLRANAAVQGKPAPRPSSGGQIEIGFTNGRTLRIGVGVDAEVLRRLIRLVEEA